MEPADYEIMQLPDVIPPGTRVMKCNSKPGDTHLDGALAHVQNVIGPAEVPGRGWMVGYQVIWDSHPGIPVFIAGHRVRAVHGAPAA